MTEVYPEHVDMLDVVADKLREHGASAGEVQRFRDEHGDMDFYARFTANQNLRVAAPDSASVQALLENARARWETADADKADESGAGEPQAAASSAPEEPAAAASSDETASSSPESEADVPRGTANEITSWVGDDPKRARLAMAVEQRSDQPRTTLMSRLSTIAGS